MIRGSVHIVRCPFEKVLLSNGFRASMIIEAEFVLGLTKKGVIKG
jgi:hypothetical protein